MKAVNTLNDDEFPPFLFDDHLFNRLLFTVVMGRKTMRELTYNSLQPLAVFMINYGLIEQST